jgi:hypothetical protein
MHEYPHRTVSRNYKIKEYAVVEYILEQFQELTGSTINGFDGCSNDQPCPGSGLPSIDDRSRRAYTVLMIAAARTNG